MWWGVPLVPLGVVLGLLIVAAGWITPLLLLLVPVAVVIMRLIVRTDDQQFRLLWMKAQCRIVKPNRNGYFWKASAYNPFKFIERK